ncbi:MAG: formylglycine-generating enzyme family protein [Paludibacteraceae bacterium]|nr:formylglycine-generating enzyme family protein [Paludibacteraceae bacterium]
MPSCRTAITALLLLLLLPLAAKKRQLVPDSLQTLTYEVNGVPIRMQRVEGGSFVMGATPDQHDPDTYTDKPAHLVFLSPYYMATTEVTNRLWRAVMSEKEMLELSGYPEHPVSFVSWHEAQRFVRRLDSITGMPFRLPTEAEWEYAARGGAQSKHYRFAGGDVSDSIGWLYSVAGNWTHPVARKQPNELGLYDMTGNVAEWCQDLYGPYQLTTAPDPCGADTGSFRIVRGGSYDEAKANCHLSVRRWYEPETSVGYIGLRVALSLPDDPMKQVVPEEPPLTQKVRIKGRRLHFYLVPGEGPYYISDEISANQWKRVMAAEPPDRERGLAVGMSRQERLRFAETCSRLADKPLEVASIAEVDSAIAKGVIDPPKPPKRKKSVRSTQRSRRTREKLSPWTELVGVRLSLPDDPVLLEYKGDANEKLPLRLVIKL